MQQQSTLNKITQIERELRKRLSYQQINLPDQVVDWSLQCRPEVEGTPNLLQFIPMMRDFYADVHPWIMAVWARQRGKTTYVATKEGHLSTTKKRQKIGYVTHEVESMSNYSEEKLRQAVFADNSILSKLVLSKTFGKITRIKLANKSVINITTHNRRYSHILGKTLNRLDFDEGQDQDLEAWSEAREAQSFTKGDFCIVGVGGYKGTKYHDFWLTTNQMVFEFDDPNWHDKLKYVYGKGVLYDDYLNDVMRGKWVAKAPENWMRHGYTLPQSAFPDIPLTIEQAKKWGINPEFSIEYREKDPTYPQSDYIRNVLAGWVEGDVKPLQSKHIYALFDKTLHFVRSEHVDHSLGPVFLGVDWGGGKKTIVWIWQLIGDKFRVLWVEQVATDDVKKQKEIVESYINQYKPDQVMLDAGGGTYQVQQLQQIFGMNVIRNFFLDRPQRPLPDAKELITLRRKKMFEVDRTYIIDVIIQLILEKRIEIPYSNPQAIEWIVDQFTAVEAEIIKSGKTESEQKHYFHADSRPDDAFMACIYAYLAFLTRGMKHTPKFSFGRMGSK